MAAVLVVMKSQNIKCHCYSQLCNCGLATSEVRRSKINILLGATSLIVK